MPDVMTVPVDPEDVALRTVDRKALASESNFRREVMPGQLPRGVLLLPPAHPLLIVIESRGLPAHNNLHLGQDPEQKSPPDTKVRRRSFFRRLSFGFGES